MQVNQAHLSDWLKSKPLWYGRILCPPGLTGIETFFL